MVKLVLHLAVFCSGTLERNRGVVTPVSGDTGISRRTGATFIGS
jgi:hypothetical protein